jgi:hypothetical protein
MLVLVHIVFHIMSILSSHAFTYQTHVTGTFVSVIFVIFVCILRFLHLSLKAKVSPLLHLWRLLLCLLSPLPMVSMSRENTYSNVYFIKRKGQLQRWPHLDLNFASPLPTLAHCPCFDSFNRLPILVLPTLVAVTKPGANMLLEV